MSETDADMNIGIGINVMQVVDETLYLPGETGLEIEELAAPQLALFEDTEVEVSDDAEVVSSTSKRNSQVLVGCRIGVHDLPAGEDNLIVDNIVTNETPSLREVR